MSATTITPQARPRAEVLSTHVRTLLEDQAATVPFHGWAHTNFVRNKAVAFAEERGADVALVEAAALVHDLNYLVEPNSPPSAGRAMRSELLTTCGYAVHEIERIEQIVDAAHITHRREQVDPETACLSDADTMYKILPITPVLFSHRYLAENGMNLRDLAQKIIREQAEKLEKNYYFYDQRLTNRYQRWTEANLGLWQVILDSLSDPDVASLIEHEPACDP